MIMRDEPSHFNLIKLKSKSSSTEERKEEVEDTFKLFNFKEVSELFL